MGHSGRQNDETSSTQGGAGRRELCKQFGTVATLIEHLYYAADLALNTG
jgi:hypothetical protein